VPAKKPVRSKPRPLPPKTPLDWLATVVATAGFVGYWPVASGTMGTLVAALLLYAVGSVPWWLDVGLCLVALPAAAWAADRYGRRTRVADHSRIVVDEVLGFWITMIALPRTPYWLALGFLLFRFFDIVKLPPASFFDERVKNGWGVVMDDVVSGVYSWIWLWLMWRASLSGALGPFQWGS
jgi:phosphatidylglycerophosphatase A